MERGLGLPLPSLGLGFLVCQMGIISASLLASTPPSWGVTSVQTRRRELRVWSTGFKERLWSGGQEGAVP